MERTLHLGQGENINDFSDNAKDDVMESDAAGSNTTSTIVLNTTQLDSTLSNVLQRLEHLEFVADVSDGQLDGQIDVPTFAQGGASDAPIIPPSSMEGIQKLLMSLSSRLGKIEALVQDSDETEPKTDFVQMDAMSPSRPSSREGDRRLALTSNAFASVAKEASKAAPNIPNITRTIFKELTGLAARVKRFEDTIEANRAFQDQKDLAQDEQLQMDMDKLEAEIKERVGREDLEKLERKMRAEMENLKAALMEKQEREALKISNDLGAGVRILRDQVKTVNEANRGITNNLDSRLKKMEKDTMSDLEALEEKLSELIDAECSHRLGELKAQIEQQLSDTEAALAALKSELQSVEEQQEALAEETHKEEGKMEGELANIGDKITALLDNGGLLEAIKEGAGPAITAVGERLDAEIRNVGSLLSEAAAAQAAEQRGLDERLTAEAKALRGMLEKGVASDLAKLDSSLAGLASQQEARMGTLSDDLARQASGLEHTEAALRESLSRSNKDIEDLQGRSQAFDDQFSELSSSVDQTLGSHSKSLENLSRLAKEHQERLGGLDSWRQLTSDTLEVHRERIDRANDGVDKANRACERIGEETRYHKRSLDGAMQMLSEELGERLDEDRVSLIQLEKTYQGQQAVCDDLRDSFGALITKESFWDVMDKRTKWHVDRLGKYSNETEDACSASDAPTLSIEARKHLSGHSQRIAKIFAAQADAAVLQSMVGTGVPRPDAMEAYATQWDAMVDDKRNGYLEQFVRRVEQAAKRGQLKRLRGGEGNNVGALPSVAEGDASISSSSSDRASAIKKSSPPMNSEAHVKEARTMFLGTLTLCLRLALSKFARILPAETILGRRGLESLHGSCAACNRPFGRDPGPGDKRGAIDSCDSSTIHSTQTYNHHHSSNGSSSNQRNSLNEIASRYSASQGGSVLSENSNDAESAASSRRSQPFKQRQKPKRMLGNPGPEWRGDNGRNQQPHQGILPGELQLQTVGEWEDGGMSVSSVASSHRNDALLRSGGHGSGHVKEGEAFAARQERGVALNLPHV